MMLSIQAALGGVRRSSSRGHNRVTRHVLGCMRASIFSYLVMVSDLARPAVHGFPFARLKSCFVVIVPLRPYCSATSRKEGS